MIKTQNMTVDELAVIVQKAFVDQQDFLTKKFEQINDRLDNLEKMSQETNYRLIILEQSQENLVLRLDSKLDKINFPKKN
jgi:hypothetical protein